MCLILLLFKTETLVNNIKKRLKVIIIYINKNKKDYANENTALLIEITQVAHYANQPQFQPTLSFNDILKIFKTESKFGLILSYIEYIVPKGDNIEFKGTVYPVYNDNCSKELKEIIKKITKEVTELKAIPAKN